MMKSDNQPGPSGNVTAVHRVSEDAKGLPSAPRSADAVMAAGAAPRPGQEAGTDRGKGRVVTFPIAAPFPALAEDDLLLERLINGEPSRAGRCPSLWADPLDAAILAACLLKQPAAGIERRRTAAQAAGRVTEAAFWAETRALFAAVTVPEAG